MAAYPYNLRVTRNLKQQIVPMKGAGVSVYESGPGGGQKVLYPDANETPGTAIEQPILTDIEGKASFFLAPGRIRVDIQLDAATTESLEDVVVDHDNIILPVVGENPAGDLDDVTFTLATSVLGERVAVYVSGIRWIKVPNNITPVGQQFNVNVDTLTLGQAPGVGATIRVDYTPAG